MKRPPYPRSIRALTIFAIAALMFASLAIYSPQAAQAAPVNCTVSDNSFDSEEQAFLVQINNYRAQNGLGALTASTNLNRMASWLANDMATHNYMSHTDSLGRTFGVRIQQCEVQYSTAAENIAAGYTTAASVFEGWRTSSGHNVNMLGSAYRQIGIARVFSASSTYGWYWSTEFSSVDDGTRATGGGGTNPTPTPAGTNPTATPTRTATPGSTTAKAVMTSPAPGSTLSGSSQTFNWSAATNAAEYFFYLGTAPGSGNLRSTSTGLNRTITVTGVPTNGSPLYVRLWTRVGSTWSYNDYTYQTQGGAAATATATRTSTPAAAATSTATSTPIPAATATPAATSAKAVMTSPAPGSRFTGASQTFNWSAATNAVEYYLYVGTAPGTNNLHNRSTGINRTATVSGLPTNGSMLYVRLWTRVGATWSFNDYTYQAQ